MSTTQLNGAFYDNDGKETDVAENMTVQDDPALPPTKRQRCLEKPTQNPARSQDAMVVDHCPGIGKVDGYSCVTRYHSESMCGCCGLIS